MTETPPRPERFYQVALPVPLPSAFEYRSNEALQTGQRVRVSFAGRFLIGIVISAAASPRTSGHTLKTINQVFENEPLLPAPVFELCQWAARYYLHPLGEVFAAALPKKIRSGDDIKAKTFQLVASPNSAERPIDSSLSRSPKQRALMLRLAQGEGFNREKLKREKYSKAVVDGLLQRGFAHWQTETPFADTYPQHVRSNRVLSATDPQSDAISTVSFKGHQTYLLYGVTGSGKTEVYLQLIEKVLEAGKQALVLIPEISLTPQTIERFRDRFEAPVVTLHSELTDRERANHWRDARSGRARIIIGTRSAIFTPTPDLGLIVVDEEHDNSYKQQDGFHYSARDLATVRGLIEKIPVVLGSATPSLESLQNVEAGKYHLLELPERANGAQKEQYTLFPVPQGQTNAFPDPALLEIIKQVLDKGEQVLVMRNRRGFAPVLYCTHCQWIAQCAQCDARLTMHKARNHLQCHHCGEQQSIPSQCPSCSQLSLIPLGEGTQRLESMLNQQFPDYPVIRIDSDSTQQRSALESMLNRVNAGGPCILVGTQLLAKGHHFTGITLALVLDVDQGFFSSDYRAIERTAQLIIQTGGRSGREALPGAVYLSTTLQDLPELQALIQSDYLTFAQNLLQQRQHHKLPPYASHATVKADARQPETAYRFLASIAQQARASHGCEILGPVRPGMEKRAGWYRAQLLVTSQSRPSRARTLIRIEKLLRENKNRSLRWSIDVDPSDLV